MPKLLITGSNGFLGEHLIKLFLNQRDWEIVATSRGKNRLQHQEGYVYREMDLFREGQVRKVLDEERPDFLIHGAAMTQVDRCEEEKVTCWTTNVEATKYLIEAAKAQDAFFVFISTDFIFDGEDGPYPEEFLPNPLNYYGVSKLAAEMLLECSGLSYSILRTVLVYGVSEDISRSNLVLWVKKSLEDKKQINVVNDQWRTPTLVQDLAEGCKLVIEHKLKGKDLQKVYNISGKEILTPYQMALEVADHFHLEASLIKKADAATFIQKAQRPAKTGFLLDAAEKDLGYHPHSFKEGLEMVEKKLLQRDL